MEEEGWLKKTVRGGMEEEGGAVQPKGRNNCGGHRFTSGSVALFWPGGGPTPSLTIEGVSRLTGVFQRPAERKTHSQTFKTFFFLLFFLSGLRLHTANGITFHADLVSRGLEKRETS